VAEYWLSFRIHDSDGFEKTYEKRREALVEQIRLASGDGSRWWFDTTSFFIFKSAESIDAIVTRVKKAIDQRVDLVVVRYLDQKTGRIVGHLNDRDILTLAPYFKEA
jgi:hypothetical protein